MIVKEFEEFAFNSHNYPTWAMDIKISLVSRGIASAIQPPETPLPIGAMPLTEQENYGALFIISHHIHPYLMSKYLHEESPSTLFFVPQNEV